MAYIGREPTFGAFETQDFVGSGSQTDFTLDFVVSTASSLAVWVNNVSQVPNTHFNTIGNILRFVTAPGTSATIKVVYLGRQHLVPIATTVPDNSITTNKIVNNAVNSTKIDILKDTPNASSIYEIIDSTDKGVLFAPQMTQTQRDAISNPATGLVLYNTTENKLNIYNGTQWENLGGVAVDTSTLAITNAADIFTNFVRDMEDHGRTSLHTEAGFVDEFESPNDMIDEANSSGFAYNETDDFYSNVSVGVNSNVEYTTESNYIQQEWSNSNQSTSQATVAGGTTVTLSSGTWPTNALNSRISFDSGSTWFDISSRDSNIQLTLDSAATNGTFDYIIRLSEFNSGKVELNTFSGNDNVTLLLHFDGSDGDTSGVGFADSSGNSHSITANGNAQIDTAESKFGGSSVLFDGIGDYLSLSHNNNFDFIVDGSDFTIETWIRWTNKTTSGIFTAGPNSLDPIYLSYYPADNTTGASGPGQMVWFVNPSGSGSPLQNVHSWLSSSISTNVWYHIAYVRSGNDFTLYVDGVQTGSTITNTTTFTSLPGTASINIGRLEFAPGAHDFNGHLDDYRITPAALFTSNFTPPTAALSSQYAVDVNPKDEHTSIVTTESFNTDIAGWVDINSASITETTDSNSDAYYWLGFDPASGYGNGTEAKIFHQGDSVWRTIAKNNAGTWEYNSSEVDKTELLLNANGSDGATTMTVEGSIGGAFTFFDNAQLDTAVKKFGTSSIQFDGTNDYVQSTTSNSAFALGNDDFTIDYWINFTAVANGKGIWAFGLHPGGHLYFNLDGNAPNTPSGFVYIFFSHPTLTNWTATSQLTLPGGTPNTGQWYHHAFVKQGTTLSFYEDGVPGGTYTIPNNGDLGTFTECKWSLGRRAIDLDGFNGHIDSFRVTRKVLWTSNFSSNLPTEPIFAGTGAEVFTGTTASTNDFLHAVSQGVKEIPENRMTKVDIESISDAEFEASNGFNQSTHTSLFRGITLHSTNLRNNISVDSYGLNHDTKGPLNLRTKQWTGTGGTPSAPSASPNTIYLFVVDEQTSGTPQYAVTRDGTNYTNVTFDTDWVFSGTKRARRASIDVTSQPAGTDPRIKITTLASDDFTLHAVGLQTKS